MPDFERVIDKLRLDLAKTPEEHAYARGYIEGKRKARRQVAMLTAFLGIIAVAVVLVVAYSRLP